MQRKFKASNPPLQLQPNATGPWFCTSHWGLRIYTVWLGICSLPRESHEVSCHPNLRLVSLCSEPRCPTNQLQSTDIAVGLGSGWSSIPEPNTETATWTHLYSTHSISPICKGTAIASISAQTSAYQRTPLSYSALCPRDQQLQLALQVLSICCCGYCTHSRNSSRPRSWTTDGHVGLTVDRWAYCVIACGILVYATPFSAAHRAMLHCHHSVTR